jgi:hypothetical protein
MSEPTGQIPNLKEEIPPLDGFPPIEANSYERIVLSEEEKAFFLREGYLVVKGVFNAEEIALYNDLFLSYYEWISKKESSPEGFSYKNKSSYKRENLVTALHGILKNYAVGHCKALWAIRSHPRLRQLFFDLIGATVCSLDGAAFIPDVDLIQKMAEKIWLHIDKDPRVAVGEFTGIQALVVGKGTRHTRVVPKSHLKDFSHLVAKGAPISHWYKPTKDGIFRIEDSLVIEANPGDMIFFMEGLVHSGTLPISGERLVYYVTGVNYDTKVTDKKELKAVKNRQLNYKRFVKKGRTTGHSNVTANAENPQHYGNPNLMAEKHFAYSQKFRENIDELKDVLPAKHFESLVQLREDPWNPTMFDLAQKPILEIVSLSKASQLYKDANAQEMKLFNAEKRKQRDGKEAKSFFRS